MGIHIATTYQENDQYVWCTLLDDNCLFRLDKLKRSLEEVIPLTENEVDGRAYYDTLSFEDQLIFVPCISEDILLVHQGNWSVESISVPTQKEGLCESNIKFGFGTVWRDNLYLFGYAYPGILILNLKTKEIRILDSWIPYVKEISISDDGCFNNEYVIKDEKIYAPLLNADAIMEFDLNTEDTKIHRIGERKQGYISIQWDGINFWIIPRNGKVGAITKWNPIFGEMQYFDNYPIEFDFHKYAFYRTKLIGNKLFLFAGYGNCNIIFDIQSGKMETFPHLYDVSGVVGCKYPTILEGQDNFLFVKEEEYILWNYKNNMMEAYTYQIEEKTLQRFEAKERKKHLQRFSEVLRNNDMCIGESEFWNLDFYLEWIKTVG